MICELFHIFFLKILDRIRQQKATIAQDKAEKVRHLCRSYLVLRHSWIYLIIQYLYDVINQIIVIHFLFRLEEYVAMLIGKLHYCLISLDVILDQNLQLMPQDKESRFLGKIFHILITCFEHVNKIFACIVISEFFIEIAQKFESVILLHVLLLEFWFVEVRLSPSAVVKANDWPPL